MVRALIVSDNGVPTGYGRIADECCIRLYQRNYNIQALSHQYDGLLPAAHNGHPLPYHVGVLAGKPNWVEALTAVVNAAKPDMIVSIQDAPYAQQIRNAPIDWSLYPFVIVTPVDGVPIDPDWIAIAKKADALLSISQFGVDAYKAAGVEATLLRPGVDVNSFYPLSTDERTALRGKLGIAPDAFVVGCMAMNQGRKAIPSTIDAFMRFAADKPDAVLLLDMEEVSPAGWHLPNVIQQQGWDMSKIRWRRDCFQAGIMHLRERYALLDVMAVISHREGYGLPLAENMACGNVSMALDYCSGPEIVGKGRGVLIKTHKFSQIGTWGGARDRFPDIDHMVKQLQMLYDNPDKRAAIAKKGMNWSRRHTWDNAADALDLALKGVLARRKPTLEHVAPTPPELPQIVPASVDGLKSEVVELVEASV